MPNPGCLFHSNNHNNFDSVLFIIFYSCRGLVSVKKCVGERECGPNMERKKKEKKSRRLAHREGRTRSLQIAFFKHS